MLLVVLFLISLFFNSFSQLLKVSWLTWTIALGSEFTASGIIMQKWFPVWVWSLVFMTLIFLSNCFSVKIFAESKFWFAAIKVAAIVAFIILGSLAIIGLIPMKGYQQAPGLANLTKDGWFPTGFSGVFKQMGIPYASDIMNFVVLTAIISAGNSGLYASTRMLWSLGNEGTIPVTFAKTNKRGSQSSPSSSACWAGASHF